MLFKKDGTIRQPWAIIVLYFNKKMNPAYYPEQGRDMLLIAVVFEITRFGVDFLKKNLGYINLLSTGITAIMLLVSVYIVTRYAFPIKLKHIGLNKLSSWNSYEKLYLLVMIPAAFFIFWYYTREKFNISLQANGFGLLFTTFIFYMAWGFYQEWIYRGLIQTELTRRYGGFTAIILANILFTFGPLHIYQLFQGQYLVIAATFIIGLIFGILFHRSYNLWIVGILHGIGNWFLAGLP